MSSPASATPPSGEPQSAAPAPPLFRAVASSTRPLFQLLKCVNFTNKIHVELTEDGVRFAANHARAMEGIAHWDKNLFTSYTTNFPTPEDGEDANPPSFQVSLSALLETLQIFGASEAAARQAKADVDPYRSNIHNYRPDAFSNQVLGMSGTCTFQYGEDGDPLRVVIEEAGVKTTCNLTTYLPEAPPSIPFDLDNLCFKIITQSRWLLDALSEIATLTPEKLTITMTKNEPYLRMSSSGLLGSTSVDFSKARDLFETFTVRGRWRQTFKFDLFKSASEAMKIASKISLRGDGEGVLNMQFMVEVEGSGVSFVVFRLLPYTTHDENEDGEGADEEDEEMHGEE